MTDDKKPVASVPPKGLDPEYVRSKLASISEAQHEQARIEAERTGASKTTSRLIAVFGTLITAAALGGFGWVWKTSADNATQGAAIERLHERQVEHDPTPPGHGEIEREVHENGRAIDGLDRAQKGINSRFDRHEADAARRHSEVLEELRRLRAARRTWGGR